MRHNHRPPSPSTVDRTRAPAVRVGVAGRRARSRRSRLLVHCRQRPRRQLPANRACATPGLGFREWGRGPAVNSKPSATRRPPVVEGLGTGDRASAADPWKARQTGYGETPTRQNAGRRADSVTSEIEGRCAVTAILATGGNRAGAGPAGQSGGAAEAETRRGSRSSSDSMRARRSSIAGSRMWPTKPVTARHAGSLG